MKPANVLIGPHSNSIPFDKTGTIYTSDLLGDALKELKPSKPASVQATANSTKTLTATSEVHQIFTGTTAGQAVRLPAANTLLTGEIFEVWNFSSQNVAVADNSGNLLATLKPNGRTQALLRDNSSVNGVWGITYTLDNGNVFGTQLFYEDADSESSNNSNTTWANKITLVTPTLPLGDYLCQFQFNWRSANADRVLEFRVQRGGVALDSGKPFTGSTADRQLISGFKRIQNISGIQTFTLDFRRGSSNTTVYMYNARLFVWRVG